MKNALIKNRDGAGIKGRVTVYEFPKGTIDVLNKMIADGKKESAFGYVRAHGKVVADNRNLIMQGASTGMDLIIQRLCSTNTYSLNITKGSIGTGTAVATISDTGLGSLVATVSPALAQDSGYDEAVIQFFFPDSTLPNQTYTEFGTWVDATQLFNRALFATPYAKSSGTDITCEVTFTISQP